MSIAPIITFKAGACDLDTSVTPYRVRPRPTPGYIYLYSEDELVHFCWRPRSAQLTDPELDLVMVPSDGTFTPYKRTSAEQPTSSADRQTNGRIYVLKFSSSSQRYLFWLQSRSQHEVDDPAWFSPRDLKLGHIVNTLLQGEEIDVQNAIANLPGRNGGGGGGGDDGGDDGDEPMEDVEGTDHNAEQHQGGSGGAGPGATGGDVREEGQESREGGADGGRAAAASSDPSSVVQDLLQSLQGNRDTQPSAEKPFPTLADLFVPASTLPLIESADMERVDHLLSFLPSSLVLLAQDLGEEIPEAEGNPELAEAITQSLSLEQKKDILQKVLRSPQFTQSLGSLTMALRDGGLPTISDGLDIQVKNGGYMRGGGMPLGGAEAIEAFLEGVKQHVDEKRGSGDNMETD